MSGVTLAWAVEIGLITWRNFKKGATDNVGGLPLPADYLATFAIFGVLGLIGGQAAKPATVLAWGYVAATALNLFDPTFSKTAQPNQSTITGSVNPNATSGNGQYPIASRPPTTTNVSGG